MTLSEYRTSSSWQGAINLGPELMRLAEELPASEEMGLSYQLRQVMIDLPAAVAGDLVQNTETRHAVGFRLLATLELVDKVYPALDTVDMRKTAEELVERFMSTELFAAAPKQPSLPVVPAPAPADVPLVDADAKKAAPVDLGPGDTTVLPDGSVGTPSSNNLATPASPTVVPVAVTTASEEVNVQPNSGQ